MGEIINLRKARRAKLRMDEAENAAENRAIHGRTLPERDRVRAEAEQAGRKLDGAKIDPE